MAVGFDGGGVAAGGRAGVAGWRAPGGGREEDRRSGLAAFLTARRGTRRGGAVTAIPPTEEAMQMTEPLTKEDLVP